jgi:hypothetical protein
LLVRSFSLGVGYSKIIKLNTSIKFKMNMLAMGFKIANIAFFLFMQIDSNDIIIIIAIYINLKSL